MLFKSFAVLQVAAGLPLEARGQAELEMCL